MFKFKIPSFKKQRIYCIDDLSHDEQKHAAQWVKDAMNGLLRERFDGVVDEMFEQLRGKQFRKDDTFTLSYTVDISAEALISAIGNAKNKR